MKLKKIFYFCLFFLLLTPVVLAVNSFDNKLVYRDISKFDKHFPSVYYFTQENVVKGYPDGHFGVDELVNRAEALKMILLASKIDLEYTSSATEEARYQDVDNEAWYAPFVWKSTKLGIIQGYQDSTFRPGNPVNMAEALKMTFYANGLDNLPVPKKAFIKDVSLDQWFSQETYYAVKNDILWPYTDYTIKPDRYLTRGELLDILYHFVLQDYKNDIAYSGKATYYSDSFQGDHTSSGEEFDQNLLTITGLTAGDFFDNPVNLVDPVYDNSKGTADFIIGSQFINLRPQVFGFWDNVDGGEY